MLASHASRLIPIFRGDLDQPIGSAKFPEIACGYPNFMIQWIGLGQNLQDNPIFNGKKPWFPVIFPLNQSIDMMNSHFPY